MVVLIHYKQWYVRCNLNKYISPEVQEYMLNTYGEDWDQLVILGWEFTQTGVVDDQDS